MNSFVTDVQRHWSTWIIFITTWSLLGWVMFSHSWPRTFQTLAEQNPVYCSHSHRSKNCTATVSGLLFSCACSTFRMPSVLEVDSPSPFPTVSSLLSLSSSGTLLSDPFLLEERELRCSLCSRPLLPGELCDWPTSSWLCCDWLCVWEASVPWETFGFGPDEVITGRGLLAWARVKWLCKNKSRRASDQGEKVEI